MHALNGLFELVGFNFGHAYRISWLYSGGTPPDG
jgi:hypothetical protein